MNHEENQKDPIKQNEDLNDTLDTSHPFDNSNDDENSSIELTPEELEEEKFRLLVLEAQKEALAKEAAERYQPSKKKRRIPRWIIWIMALVLLFQPIAFIFDIYSLPAIEFLKKSSQLSKRADIAQWKQSVAVVLTEDGKGTGFVVSNDGLIVTNNHVVENTTQITVSFDEVGRFPATLIGQDSVNDLALLKIKNPPDVQSLEIAESPSYTPDSVVRFIGNPLNFYGIANEGTIIEETTWAGRTEPIILLDAPVYRGNSGSPVFQNDKVIGVVFAVTDLESYGKVGMFIRSEEVLALLRSVQ
ncbi:S1C family serine protease [Sporosarcina aquimarina]|uniref:Serine protease n=1 Tax=Sporosarcina aquimarina TaxID=114975 RepID=A0ABU4G4J3_9BACL|nr:serine protease [Sporosarcina aquimarina]MDW0111302.1 serine protease [Sporosarcina aquimarina]